MKNRSKKWLVVAGCLVICAALIALLGNSLPQETPQGDPVLMTDKTPSDAGTGGADVKTDDTPAVVVKPNQGTPAASGNGAVSRGTEQTIQPDVTSPEPPDDETLSDPTMTPDGQKVDGSPEPVDHGSVQQPTNPPPQQGQPSGGGGLPGFGSVPNAGANQGSQVDSEGDINKQIGIMD